MKVGWKHLNNGVYKDSGDGWRIAATTYSRPSRPGEAVAEAAYIAKCIRTRQHLIDVTVEVMDDNNDAELVALLTDILMDGENVPMDEIGIE